MTGIAVVTTRLSSVTMNTATEVIASVLPQADATPAEQMHGIV